MIWFSLQTAKAKPAVLPNEKCLSGMIWKKPNNQTIACELALSDGRKKGFHYKGEKTSKHDQRGSKDKTPNIGKNRKNVTISSIGI